MGFRAWANSDRLELIKTRNVPKPDHRRFLVFVVPQRAMVSPLVVAALKERNFDIAARFFEAPDDNSDLLRSAEFVMTGGLSKFHAASQFLEITNLQEAYEGYLFLDGDLEFDASRLSGFLSFVDACKFSLAQPSVSRDSYCYWKMAYHQPGYVFRETSFVEVMAPYLSRGALSRLQPTFTKSISTYGLDLVWPTLIGNAAIAVIDSFQMRHKDRVDHTSGNFYKYLKSIGVDLDEEERLILEEYGVKAETAHSRRGYFWKRHWPFLSQTQELVSVQLDGPEKNSEKQILIDLAMRRARWRPSRPEPDLEAAVRDLLLGKCV